MHLAAGYGSQTGTVVERVRADYTCTAKIDAYKVVIACKCIILNYRYLYEVGVGECEARIGLIFGILDKSGVNLGILGRIQGIAVENVTLGEIICVVLTGDRRKVARASERAVPNSRSLGGLSLSDKSAELNGFNGLVVVKCISVEANNHVDLIVIGYKVVDNNLLALCTGGVDRVVSAFAVALSLLTDDSSHLLKVYGIVDALRVGVSGKHGGDVYNSATKGGCVLPAIAAVNNDILAE